MSNEEIRAGALRVGLAIQNIALKLPKSEYDDIKSNLEVIEAETLKFVKALQEAN